MPAGQDLRLRRARSLTERCSRTAAPGNVRGRRSPLRGLCTTPFAARQVTTKVGELGESLMIHASTGHGYYPARPAGAWVKNGQIRVDRRVKVTDAREGSPGEPQHIRSRSLCAAFHSARPGKTEQARTKAHVLLCRSPLING